MTLVASLQDFSEPLVRQLVSDWEMPRWVSHTEQGFINFHMGVTGVSQLGLGFTYTFRLRVGQCISHKLLRPAQMPAEETPLCRSGRLNRTVRKVLISHFPGGETDLQEAMQEGWVGPQLHPQPLPPRCP